MTIIRRYLPLFIFAGLVALLGAGCTKNARKNRLLAQAERDFQAGKYEPAEVEYLNVMRLSPMNPLAVAHLAVIYEAQGRMSQAYPYLQKGIQLKPDYLTLQVKLAHLYAESRSFDKARELLLKVLAKEPENSEALLLLVQIAQNTDEVRQAIQTLQQLPQQLGGGAYYQLALASAHLRLRDLDQAETEFKHALSLNPKSSDIMLGIATLAVAHTNFDEAESALKTATQLAPPRSVTPLKYADFILKKRPNAQGRLEAKSVVDDVLKKTPDYLPAWLFQARLAQATGNFVDAEAALNHVVSRDPFNYEAYVLLGDLAMEQRDAPKAISRYTSLLKLSKDSPAVQYKLARALALNRESARASDLLRQILAKNPKFVEASLLLAEFNLSQGYSEQVRVSMTQAIAYLNEALKRQTTQPQEDKLLLDALYKAYSLLAKAYLKEGRVPDAIKLYRNMMRLFDPNKEEVLLTAYQLGQVFEHYNRLKEARGAYEEVLRLAPDSSVGLSALVELDVKENDYPGALARVNQELHAKPAKGELYYILGGIYWRRATALVDQKKKSSPQIKKNLTMADVPEAQPDAGLAEDAFKKAIELKPDLRTTYLQLAELYVASNQHEQALQRLSGLTNDSRALMLRGMIYDHLQDFPKARDAYEAVLALDSQATESEAGVRGMAMNNLAYIYSERLGRIDKGYEMATKARDLQPYDPLTADTLGWILYQRGDFTRALGLITESADKLALDPQMAHEPEVQLHLGLTHYMLGDELQARDELSIAVQAPRDFPHKQEGKERLEILAIDPKTADPKAAVATLNKRLQQAPADPIATLRLAAIREREGAPKEALEICQASLKLNPQNAQLLSQAARLAAPDQPAKALDWAKEANRLAPDDARISHLLGQLAYQSGQHRWSETLLEDSAEKLPTDPQVLYDLAWAQYSLGRVPDALATMQKVLQAGSAFHHARQAEQFKTLATVANGGTIASTAEAQAQQALAADTNYIPGLMVLALAQEQKRQTNEAVLFYERILSHFPLFAPAARDLAILNFNLGRDARAYELASHVRENFPNDLDLAKALGILAYRRSDFDLATQRLTQCTAQRRSDAELWFYLGMAQFKLNRFSDSQRSLDAAMALNLEPKLKQDAQRTLKDIADRRPAVPAKPKSTDAARQVTKGAP